MLETDSALVSVNVSRTMIERLQEWGYDDSEQLGRLGADIGDLYASASRLRAIVDQLEKTPTSDRDLLGDLLSDLYEEVSHMHHHAESCMPDLDELAERFDI